MSPADVRTLGALASIIAAFTSPLASPLDRAVEPPISASAEAEDGLIVALRAPAPSTVKIPAGTFTMGSTAEEVERVLEACKRMPFRGLSASPPCLERAIAIEREAHEVSLSAFRIDTKEVSVRAYRRCVEAGRCSSARAEGGRRFDEPDHPVALVDWDDAVSYCDFVGGRLPTEAEWERAARGQEGRRYPWGDIFHPGRANFGGDSLDRHDDRDGFLELAPVGSYPQGRTREGIHDLAGNVAEWVADGFDAGEDLVHRGASVKDPLRRGNPYRIVRGGGFRSPWFMLRSSARLVAPASTRAPDIGFRCAYDAR